MRSENDNGIPREPGQGLGVSSQIALQFELLRLAGVRFVPGNLALLKDLGARASRVKPKESVGPPSRPLEVPSPGQRFSDLVRNRQPMPSPEAPTPVASKPVEPPPVETARTSVPLPPKPSLTKITDNSGPLETRSFASAGLFPLDQAVNQAAEVENLDPQARLDLLEQLRQEVARCNRCPALAAERTQTVFGVGPIDPELCVIGEAPGFNEDKLGEPFVGEAGQLLNKMLGACGFDRSQVFICNILRCRPPGNRTPLPDEAQMCNPFLIRTVELVRPKFICLLGATATRYFLDQSTGVGVLRKRDLKWRGIPVQATYHPAYLLRYPDKKRDAWEDLQRMLARMGKAPPGK